MSEIGGWRGYPGCPGALRQSFRLSSTLFPEWLLERRRRAEQALISVVATSYLLGVSTRRVDKLVEQLGIKHISKSQVSEMAKVLDGQVEDTPQQNPIPQTLTA